MSTRTQPVDTHSTYPAQTRFAFRPGITCVTTPSAAVLLNPPRSEKLTGLTAAPLQALKTLNSGPATALAMSEPARGTTFSH